MLLYSSSVVLPSSTRRRIVPTLPNPEDGLETDPENEPEREDEGEHRREPGPERDPKREKDGPKRNQEDCDEDSEQEDGGEEDGDEESDGDGSCCNKTSELLRVVVDDGLQEEVKKKSGIGASNIEYDACNFGVESSLRVLCTVPCIPCRRENIEQEQPVEKNST